MINSNNESEEKNRETKREEKILVKNTFYSLFTSFSNFAFSIITVFFIARLISKNDWGLLILATSLISIFTLILVFLPPSLGLSIIFYASEFKALNQNRKLKSFIKNALILRILFVIIIFFLSILIFWIFKEVFSLNQIEYIYIFLLLCPQIIINGITEVFSSIAQSLNLFKLNYFSLLIKNIIYIGGLIYLYFIVDSVKVYHIAAIIIISMLIPFILHFTIILIILKFKIKKTDEGIESFRETFKKIYKYGSYLTTINFIGRFHTEMITQLIGFYEPTSIVSGYNIANRYNSIPTLTITSIFRPLTIYSIRLISKKRLVQIKRLFNLLFSYLLILLLLITGVLFFSVDIFLFVLYGESYLTFSILVKLFLFLPIFSMQNSFFDSYFMASNKVRKLSVIALATGSFKLAFFAVGIIFFNIIIAVIFSLVASLVIMVVHILILIKFNITIRMKKPLIIYSVFFISLFVSSILDKLFLNDIYIFILKKINLSFFQYLNLPSLGLYLLIFLGLIIVLKILSHSDIEKIESIFIKDNFSHRFIRKGLKISKKFVRV